MTDPLPGKYLAWATARRDDRADMMPRTRTAISDELANGATLYDVTISDALLFTGDE